MITIPEPPEVFDPPEPPDGPPPPPPVFVVPDAGPIDGPPPFPPPTYGPPGPPPIPIFGCTLELPPPPAAAIITAFSLVLLVLNISQYTHFFVYLYKIILISNHNTTWISS